MHSSPQRVPAGTTAGGQFAATAHTESNVALSPPGAATTWSRFDSAGPIRRACAPRYEHNDSYFGERRQALSHLHRFGERDLVVVSDEQGREHPGVVLRPRRSDGDYGSPESWTVPVSLGPGRYTFDVTAHRLATGELGIRHATMAEQEQIRAHLEQARLDNAVAQQERVRDAHRRLAEVGLPPVGSRVTVDWGNGPAGKVTLHDLTQDGTRAAVIWDDLPGTSLVPVARLKQRR